MPALTGGNLTKWRTHPQSVELYCYILNPTVVASRRVNMATISYPVHTLTFDNPDADAGDTADVVAGETIWVKDGTTGEPKGFLRVRAAPSGSTVKVGVVSQGEIDIKDNDILEFLYCHRVWSKQPSADANGAPLKDWDISFSLASSQPPVANAGPWFARKIDPSTNIITVTFDATGSFPVRNGATISSYLWDFVDGTVTVGSTSSTTATVTFPAGYRWISLTATDSNSQTHTAYALIVAADDNTALPVSLSNLACELDSGWECALDVFSGDVSDYPPGTAIIIWAEESYGGVAGSLNGYGGREHVKFTGWIVDDTTIVHPHYSDWQIQAVGPIGMLSRRSAYSYTFEYSSNPSSWFQIEYMTYWKFIHHLMHWDSTVLEVCDVEQSPVYNVYDAPVYDADPGAFINQLRFTTNGVASKVTCDHKGRLYFRRYPHMMGTTERDALPTTVNLEGQDWSNDLTIRTRNHQPVALVTGYGGLAVGSEITALKSIAPGTTQGQGENQETLNRQIVLSQTELNERVGRYYALKNLDQPDLGAEIMGMGMIADPAWMEWIDIDLAASSNARGIGYTDQRFLLTSISVDFDHAAATAIERWRLEKATPDVVIKGVTQVIPGVDPPEDTGEVYIPSDGTYIEQPTQDISVFPPVIVPEELGQTLDVFVWSDEFLAGAAGFAPTEWYPMYQADGEILDVMFNHSTPYVSTKDGPLGIYILDYDSGADETTIKYSPDALSLDGPVYYVQQVLSGRYSLLRRVPSIPNGIAAMGGPTSPPGYYLGDAVSDVVISDDGTGGWIGDGELLSAGPDGKIYGVVYTISETNSSSASNRISAALSGGDPPHTGLWGDTSDNNNDGTYIYAETDVNDDLNPGGWTWQDEIASGPLPATGDRWVGWRHGFNVNGTTTFSNIRPIYYGAEGGATGLFVYSDDGFSTISSVRTFGDGTGLACADVDDYGQGITLAAHGSRIYYATEYGGAFSLASGANVSPSYHVAIRIPNKKVTDHQAANSDPTALEFIFATRDKLSDDSTLWWATINTTTGVITDGGEITPIVSATTYVCIENPNALETYGGNPKRLRLLARDESNESDDTVLLDTVDLGANWILQQDPADYVALWHTSYDSFYLAGEDGLKFTSDAGDNLSNFDGDYETVVDNFPMRGVFSL